MTALWFGKIVNQLLGVPPVVEYLITVLEEVKREESELFVNLNKSTLAVVVGEPGVKGAMEKLSTKTILDVLF